MLLFFSVIPVRYELSPLSVGVLTDCHHRFLDVNPMLAFFLSTEGGSSFDVRNIELMLCEPIEFWNRIRIVIFLSACRSPVSFLLIFEFLRLFFGNVDGQGASVFEGESSFHVKNLMNGFRFQCLKFLVDLFCHHQVDVFREAYQDFDLGFGDPFNFFGLQKFALPFEMFELVERRLERLPHYGRNFRMREFESMSYLTHAFVRSFDVSHVNVRWRSHAWHSTLPCLRCAWKIGR